MLELPVLEAKRCCVLIPFLDLNEVREIPEVLSNISKISGTGYRFFTVDSLRARYSTHSRHPSSFFFTNLIGPAAGSDELYSSQLLVSLALSEIS